MLQRTLNNYALRSKVKDIFEYAHHAEYWESIMTTYENNSQNKSVYNSQGTFELRIRSEFYCSNDKIVGHISLPHNRETVMSMFISRLL